MNSSALAHGDFDGDRYEDTAIMTTEYSADYQFFFGSAEPSLVPVAITHTVLLKKNAESRKTSSEIRLSEEMQMVVTRVESDPSWLSRMPVETSNTKKFVLYLVPCHQPSNFQPLD